MTEKGVSTQNSFTSSYQRGYIVGNINDISKRFICEFCSLILREPMQLTECGHHLCKSCVELQGDPMICPNSECRQESFKRQVMFDRAFKRELGRLWVECRCCSWKGLLGDYQSHLDDRHPKLICDQCNAEFDSTFSLKYHKLNECSTSVSTHNPLKDFDSLKTFMQQFIEKHINEKYRNIPLNSSSCDSLEPPQKKTKNDATVPGINADKDEAGKFSNVLPDDSVIILLQKDNQTMKIFSNESSATNHESKCHSDEIISLQNSSQNCTQEVEVMKAKIQQLNGLYTELKHKQRDLQQQVALAHQIPDQREFTTYNGILIWKMTNFQAKMRDAQSQQTPWIESVPFWTSSTGYKVRVRVYLNGAGDALGTHLSIFFILMRGDNDAWLIFPFNYKVSFCLFDQTPQQRHIIKSIRPKGSASFQRPQSEINIPHEMLKFCSLATFQQVGSPYIQDDSILIKVMINTGDIPRTLLPYALSLESGLSIDVQRAMIRKKQEKQDQSRIARAAATSQNDLELSQSTLNLTRPSIQPSQRQQSPSSTSGSRGMSPQDQQDDDTSNS